MARALIILRRFQANGVHVEDFGQAIDAANGMYLPNAEPERLVIRYTNDHATDAFVFKIRGGDAPPGIAAGQGDLSESVAAQATHWYGPFDSSRFLQSNGSIELDWTGAGAQGFVTVFYVPRNT